MTMTNKVIDATGVDYAQAEEKGRVLGAAFWFDLKQGATFQELFDSADALGFNRSFLPSARNPKDSFRYAIRQASVGSEYKTELIKASSKAYLLGSILEKQETANRLDYSQVNRVALALHDKNGNPLQDPRVVAEKECKIAENVRRLYSWHLEHLTPDDIRPTCTGTVRRLGGVTLRQNGGVYFIPSNGLDELRDLVKILSSVRCVGHIMPILKNQESVETIKAVSTISIQSEVEGIFDEAEDFLHALETSDKKVRESTVEARVQALRDLRAKADLYASILETQSGDLLQTIEDCEAKLEEVLDLF